MAAEVFAIPELAAMVVQYLPHRDIAACKLTSKAFNSTFNPHFWKHFSVTDDEKSKSQAVIFQRIKEAECLYRNRQYIATLNLELFAAVHLYALLNITSTHKTDAVPSVLVQEPAGPTPEAGFLRLKSISIAVGAIQCGYLSKMDSVIPTAPLIHLLVSAPNITRLTLYPEVLESAQFIATLKSDLHNLQTLILVRAQKFCYKSLALVPVLSALPALFAKPSLTTLELRFYLHLARDDSPALVTKALDDLAENSKAKSAITNMVFPSMANLPSLLKPLLKSCLPQLQIFNVPYMNSWELAQLTAIVQDHCPHVHELNLDRLQDIIDTRPISKQVARLIASCRNLRVYHGPYYVEDEDHRAFTQALLQHASTLESVTIVGEMSDSAFTSLISNMRALRTLDLPYPFSVDAEDAISARWAPRHLQRLQLTIELFSASLYFVKRQKLHLDPELNPHLPSEELDQVGLSHVAIRKLFKSIGELTELEDLTLKYCRNSKWRSDKDWTLEVGLGFLGGLVKLRKVWLGHGVENVGQAEVEFMYKHWPKLEEVVFYIEKSHLDRIHQPWAWLKARRPHLKYTYNTFVVRDPIYSDDFLRCTLEEQ